MMTLRSGLPLGRKLTGQQLNHFVVFNCLLLLAILPVRILEWFCHEFCMRTARRAVQQFPYICFLVRVQKLKKQGYSNQNQNGEILVSLLCFDLLYIHSRRSLPSSAIQSMNCSEFSTSSDAICCRIDRYKQAAP